MCLPKPIRLRRHRFPAVAACLIALFFCTTILALSFTPEARGVLLSILFDWSAK